MKKALTLILLLCSVRAWATDIQCDRTQQPGQRVVCDFAILSHEYEGIYDQQQQMIQQHRLSPAVLADWQRRRDACRDPHCMDGVFAQWSSIAKNLTTVAVAPAMTASEALGPAPGSDGAANSDALPASSPLAAAVQQASNVPVARQGSALGVALPQAVQPDAASASASGPAIPASPAASDEHTPASMSTGLLVLPVVVLLILALLAVGAWVMYRKRRGTRAR